MVVEFAPHFELESLFRTLYLAAVFSFDLCDVTTVAECSVKNNSQVCWGWSALNFFSAPRDVQISAGFSVSDMEYACLWLSWVGGF